MTTTGSRKAVEAPPQDSVLKQGLHTRNIQLYDSVYSMSGPR